MYVIVFHSRESETFLISLEKKKTASSLDNISSFLSNHFVTWYLRSISKTKIVKFFCPCLSDQTIYCIKRNPDDRVSYKVHEIVCTYVLSVGCSIQNFVTHILVHDPVSCEVTNVSNRYMNFILELEEEFDFQRPVCLDSNNQSKIC